MDERSLALVQRRARFFGHEEVRIEGDLMPFDEAVRRGAELVDCSACGGGGTVVNFLFTEGRFSDPFPCSVCDGKGQMTRADSLYAATQGTCSWTPEHEVLASGVMECPGCDEEDQTAIFTSYRGVDLEAEMGMDDITDRKGAK